MSNISETASSAATQASETIQAAASKITNSASSNSNTNPMNQYYDEHSDSSTAPASSKGGQTGAPQDETMAAQLTGNQEPVNAKQGKGTSDEPFDGGNEDEVRDAEARAASGAAA